MNREKPTFHAPRLGFRTGSPVHPTAVVFLTRLGWMAMVGWDGLLERLSFGYGSAEAARRAVEAGQADEGPPDTWSLELAGRLAAYADGVPDDFSDVRVDLEGMPGFRRRVLALCRGIPYGSTLTYGQLARKAGSAGAARAVGSAMAANRVPLVIPCHRVVGANGGLGGYSAVGGVRVKRRLLELEARGDRR